MKQAALRQSQQPERHAVAIREEGGWNVTLYDTVIFSGKCQTKMECLAADINIAIHRHEGKRNEMSANRQRQTFNVTRVAYKLFKESCGVGTMTEAITSTDFYVKVDQCELI